MNKMYGEIPKIYKEVYEMPLGNSGTKIALEENEWKIIFDNLKGRYPEFSKEENFYEGIVKSLKGDANKLNKQLSVAMNNCDMQLYISTIKSLRDTLDLISKYDWRLMFSEYTVTDDQNNSTKQVAVWEQNHDAQIKNHKVWNIAKKAMEIDANGDLTFDSVIIVK